MPLCTALGRGGSWVCLPHLRRPLLAELLAKSFLPCIINGASHGNGSRQFGRDRPPRHIHPEPKTSFGTVDAATIPPATPGRQDRNAVSSANPSPIAAISPEPTARPSVWSARLTDNSFQESDSVRRCGQRRPAFSASREPPNCHRRPVSRRSRPLLT